MKGLISIAALSCALTGVEANVKRGPFRWSEEKEERDWLPAMKTPALDAMNILMGPAPTAAPNFDVAALHKRSVTDNTCAYVSGSSDYPLYCSTDSACVYNSLRSNIGCCPDTSTTCNIFTTCYPSSQGNAFTTNNGLTLFCGSSAYPNCVQHIYADTIFANYTLWGCGKTSGTDAVYYYATDVSSTSSTSSSSSSSSSSTSSTSSSTTTVTSAPTSSTPAASSGSSAPVGAIAGGVVGGVAVIGLIGLGAFFLLRKNRKNKNNGGGVSPGQQGPQSPMSGPGMYGGAPAPQMAQHPSTYGAPGGFVPVDNRASIAKPPYNVTQSAVYDPSQFTVSPPGSPPPPHYGYSNVGNTPPPQGHSPVGFGQPSPSAGQWPQPSPPAVNAQNTGGMGYQSGPVPNYNQAHVAELPSERGDQELRELA